MPPVGSKQRRILQHPQTRLLLHHLLFALEISRRSSLLALIPERDDVVVVVMVAVVAARAAVSVVVVVFSVLADNKGLHWGVFVRVLLDKTQFSFNFYRPVQHAKMY